MQRCDWVTKHPELTEYHDTEWGTPTHNDRQIFGWLCYNVLQAGLGWIMMLKKRTGFAGALDDYDPHRVAAYGGAEIERLMSDQRMIRNRQKIRALINNAQKFCELEREYGSFDAYIWRFTGEQTLYCRHGDDETCPEDESEYPEVELLSRDLKRRGWQFMGPKTVYGVMEDIGMINNHQRKCFRYAEIQRLAGNDQP